MCFLSRRWRISWNKHFWHCARVIRHRCALWPTHCCLVSSRRFSSQSVWELKSMWRVGGGGASQTSLSLSLTHTDTHHNYNTDALFVEAPLWNLEDFQQFSLHAHLYGESEASLISSSHWCCSRCNYGLLSDYQRLSLTNHNFWYRLTKYTKWTRTFVSGRLFMNGPKRKHNGKSLEPIQKIVRENTGCSWIPMSMCLRVLGLRLALRCAVATVVQWESLHSHQFW